MTERSPDVLVIQAGARHDYLIPQMLHAEGRLAGLVTDFCVGEGLPLPRWIEKVSTLWPEEVTRRTARELPADLIFASPFVTAASRLTERVIPGVGPFVEDIGLGLRASRARRDVRFVYSVYGTGERYLRVARARGAKIVSDVIITPIAHRIEAEERSRFPGWEMPKKCVRFDKWMDAKTERMLRISDVLICPSEVVVNDLSSFAGFDPSRAVVVPYGSRFRTATRSCPVPGRVLFVGTASLRKGIQYLARAADLAREKNADIEFVVAGPVTEMIRTRSETRALKFLGKLDSSAVANEYSIADIFVLPTLAEGSAGVIYEALAFGLPIVTTRAAGSIILDDVEGRIVRERDFEALAEAVLNIVENRSLRERYAAAARASAVQNSGAQWGRRLLSILAD